MWSDSLRLLKAIQLASFGLRSTKRVNGRDVLKYQSYGKYDTVVVAKMKRELVNLCSAWGEIPNQWPLDQLMALIIVNRNTTEKRAFLEKLKKYPNGILPYKEARKSVGSKQSAIVRSKREVQRLRKEASKDAEIAELRLLLAQAKGT